MKIVRLLLLLSIVPSLAAYGRRDTPYTIIEHEMPLAGGSSALLAVDATVHKSTKMFNEGHKKCELFSGLGNSFENLDPRIVQNIPSPTLSKTIDFLTDFRVTGSPDSTVSGESLYRRVTAHVMKGFDSGLYARLEVPFVEHHLHCTDVTFTKNNGTASDADLLIKLDAMLGEYGLQPLKTDAIERGVGDIIALIGWHGYERHEDEEITGMRIRIEGGVIIPTAREQEGEKVFAPSLGYNRHIGFMGRVEAGLCAWDLLEAGGQMNMTVFLNHRTERRVAVSPLQKGFIYLNKAYVDENLGSIWGFGGHLKLKPITGGFFIATHYSYAAQSNTRYLILNTNDPVNPGDTASTALTFNNAIANEAPLLSGWYHHGITFAVGFEPHEDHDRSVAVHTRAFVQLPISGSKSFMSMGVGAGLGLEFGLSF